jgi:hypothetical protein
VKIVDEETMATIKEVGRTYGIPIFWFIFNCFLGLGGSKRSRRSAFDVPGPDEYWEPTWDIHWGK